MVKRVKRWYKRCKGFTLMEVLVTVLIIGVLAAISYPVYKKSVTKARAAEAVNLIQLVKNKQILTHANEGKYFSDFGKVGRITQGVEEAQGAQLTVNRDYTVYLNNAQTCVTAYYKKDTPAEFSFSSGYENDGLGCSGGVCNSYGNILGDTKSVCNCGTKTCENGYTLNQDTCSCECLLGCENGGSCYAPYGGGQSRPCASGCGTEYSSSTCGGPSWSGSCSSPTQTQATSQRCGRANSGTQTRTCSATCGGGECGSWSACKGQTCDENSKPVLSESCGNNGTHTRTVTCNSDTGNWNTPSEWSVCTGQTCDEGSKPATSQSCGGSGTQTRTVTCNTNTGNWDYSGWSECECNSGYHMQGGMCKPMVSATTKTLSIYIPVTTTSQYRSSSFSQCLNGSGSTSSLSANCSLGSKVYYDGGSLTYVPGEGDPDSSSSSAMSSGCVDTGDHCHWAQYKAGRYKGYSGGRIVSVPAQCPSGSDSDICMSKGAGFTCLKSEYIPEPSTARSFGAFSGKDCNGYAGTCTPAYCEVCNDVKGTATILSCE